jgi:hypothetical protein
VAVRVLAEAEQPLRGQQENGDPWPVGIPGGGGDEVVDMNVCRYHKSNDATPSGITQRLRL